MLLRSGTPTSIIATLARMAVVRCVSVSNQPKVIVVSI